MTESEFNVRYLGLSDILFRVARYILEDDREAEDAVQETYLKLWASRSSLDQVENPKAYSIRMIRNICLDRLRKASHLVFPDHLPEVPDVPDSVDVLDARKRLDNVLEAVKALPERQRQVLLLRTVDGLPYGEIAEKTGLNYLTLRVLLSQARAKLRKNI